MLLNIYKAVGGAICLWFGIAAVAGWKAPSLGTGGGSRAGGYYSTGGGRYSSGAGGWGGGK